MEKLEVNGRVYVTKPAKNLVAISYTIDNKEHEITLNLEDIACVVSGKGTSGWIDAEITIGPSCCEHPDGCL